MQLYNNQGKEKENTFLFYIQIKSGNQKKINKKFMKKKRLNSILMIFYFIFYTLHFLKFIIPYFSCLSFLKHQEYIINRKKGKKKESVYNKEQEKHLFRKTKKNKTKFYNTTEHNTIFVYASIFQGKYIIIVIIITIS